MQKTSAPLIAALSWLIISTVLLILPGAAFPKEDWLDKIWFDKWVHIAMFFLMVVLWCMALHSQQYSTERLKRYFILAAVLSLAYGILMEFIQGSLVRNRSFDTGDIIADAVGCIIGWWFSSGRYIKK